MVLQSNGWLVRVTAAECLRKIGNKRDAEAVRALAGDKAKLMEWWGDQSELPKKHRKKPIALGPVGKR